MERAHRRKRRRTSFWCSMVAEAPESGGKRPDIPDEFRIPVDIAELGFELTEAMCKGGDDHFAELEAAWALDSSRRSSHLLTGLPGTDASGCSTTRR